MDGLARVSIIGVKLNHNGTATIKAKIINPSSEDLNIENLDTLVLLGNGNQYKKQLDFKDIIGKNDEKTVELVVPLPANEMIQTGMKSVSVKIKVKIYIPFVGEVEVEIDV